MVGRVPGDAVVEAPEVFPEHDGGADVLGQEEVLAYKACVAPDGTKVYGKHTLLYLGQCNEKLLDLTYMKALIVKVCAMLDMRRYGPCTGHRFGIGNEVGLSIFQMIYSSNVSMHSNDGSLECYLDIFSCQPYCLDSVLIYLKEELTPENFNVKTIYRR